MTGLGLLFFDGRCRKRTSALRFDNNTAYQQNAAQSDHGTSLRNQVARVRQRRAGGKRRNPLGRPEQTRLRGGRLRPAPSPWLPPGEALPVSRCGEREPPARAPALGRNRRPSPCWGCRGRAVKRRLSRRHHSCSSSGLGGRGRRPCCRPERRPWASGNTPSDSRAGKSLQGAGAAQTPGAIASPPWDGRLLRQSQRAGCRRRSPGRGLLGRRGASGRCSTWRAGARRQQLRQRGGLAGRRLGGKRQGGTPRGPVPASRAGSRLRVINGFPGSRAGAGARAGRQPAQHPGRLPRLSSPTSFAPSSGDEPPWSLQARRTRPRGSGHLSRGGAWLSRSPGRGRPRLPSPAPAPPPGDPGAGSAGSPAVQPSSPQRAAGSGLQHPSGRKAPSLPYRPGGRGSSGSGGRSLWCFMAGQLLSKSSVGWGRWGRGGGFPHGFWEEAEQRGPRPGGAPSLQPEPRAALAAGVSPRPQVSSRTRGEGSLKGPPTAARAAPQVLVTKGSTWLPVICWGLSFFFFFFRHRLFSFFAFDIHVWFVNAKTRIPAFSQ